MQCLCRLYFFKLLTMHYLWEQSKQKDLIEKVKTDFQENSTLLAFSYGKQLSNFQIH